VKWQNCVLSPVIKEVKTKKNEEKCFGWLWVFLFAAEL